MMVMEEKPERVEQREGLKGPRREGEGKRWEVETKGKI